MAYVDLTGEVATATAIAKVTGYSRNRIARIIRVHGIDPVTRAGNVRVFDDAAVDVIVSEADAIEAASVCPGPMLELIR